MAPLLFSFLLLLLFSINNLPKAQSYSNISLGTTFTPLPSSTTFTKWPSPSGDFAFGFRALHSNTSLFLLGVFYDKIPNKTLVWTANGASPVTNGSTAVLTRDGQLSLTDPTGQEIWNAAGATTSIFKAEIQDTGNFVLYDQSSTILFQTFQNVTDTILPGQSLPQGTAIYSRLMDDDYSRGRFELILQTDANLVNYMVAYPSTNVYTDSPYWASGTPGTGDNTLVYNESSGSIYLSYANTSLNKGVLSAPNVDNVGSYYMRATMDPDGVFRQYTFPKNNPTTGSWVMHGGLSTDICDTLYQTGSGPCGFNSYCTYEAADHRKPKCHCPENYILLDPTREYKGCIANFITQPCKPGGEIGFNFTAVNNLDWPFSDAANWPYIDADPFSSMNVTDCTDNCLKDCLCMVAIYDNKTSSCWKKKFPLSNGKMNSNVDTVAYIKYSTVNASSVPTSVLPGSVERKNDWTHRRNWVVAVACILVGSAILNLALVGAFFVYPRNKQASATSQSSRNIGGSTLCSFTYEDLEKATKGFSEEVGRGAYGHYNI